MAEQIGDLLQADPGIHHLTRHGMAEQMSAPPRRSWEARLQQASMDELTDGRSPRPGAMRRLRLEEEGALRTGWTGLPEIGGYGSTDLFRQGQHPLASCLPGTDVNEALLPVEIVESQPGHFPRSQTQPHQ